MNYHDEIKNRIDSNVAKIANLHEGKASVLADKFFLQVVLPSMCDIVYCKGENEKMYRDYEIKVNALSDSTPLVDNAIAYLEDRCNPMPCLNIVKALVYFKEKWELQIKSDNNRLSYEIESLLDTEEYEENEKRFCKYFDALYEYAKDNQDIFINFEKVDRAKPIQEPSEERDEWQR